MDDKQKEELTILEDKANGFCTCFGFLEKEKDEYSRKEVISALKVILRNYVREIFDLLKSLKEAIAWSFLDDNKEKFYKINIELGAKLAAYKVFEEDEDKLSLINETMLLLSEGCQGFRLSFTDDNYYKNLFQKVLKKYRQENEKRLELIYKQDYQDETVIYSDGTQLKKAILIERRNSLFDSIFGKVFHNNGRDITKTVVYILEQKEQTDANINDFLDKFLSYQIAMEHCNTQKENKFENIVFKDNVNVDKVMLKLKDFIADNTLSAQKHWFIVYKVLSSKSWLKVKTQKRFAEQINSAFGLSLKCTTNDLKKVDSYFKSKDYKKWTLDDKNAPTCCDKYKEIANKLDYEFEDSKYAKPGKTITTQRIEKFR